MNLLLTNARIPWSKDLLNLLKTWCPIVPMATILWSTDLLKTLRPILLMAMIPPGCPEGSASLPLTSHPVVPVDPGVLLAITDQALVGEPA
jgi:hypothetical protein